jgi:beta-glucosidase
VTEAEIDASLALLLRTRFKLGLFDREEGNPYASIPPEVVNSAGHRALAREAAVKSIVLLRNAEGVLPLSRDLQKIFVTGPLAADGAVLLGNYSGVSSDLSTILEGVVGAVGPATMVSYRQGALLDRENVNPMDWYSDTAIDADVTIAVMGISNLLEGEEGASLASPGKGDRFDTRLPPNQIDFLTRIRGKANKLVVILLGGSPMAIPEVHDMADAVVLAWYPGEEGGRAVADVLFGEVSPSGRLPITFPESLDQLPPYDDYSMRGRTYRYMEKQPLYPFGFGLSYTSFEYGKISLDREQMEQSGRVKASVTVTNTGPVAAEEVVQLYVSDTDAAFEVPLASLKGFERVALDPGESREVSFSITRDQLEVVNDAGERAVDPGVFELIIGGASPGERPVELGAARPARAILTVR